MDTCIDYTTAVRPRMLMSTHAGSFWLQMDLSQSQVFATQLQNQMLEAQGLIADLEDDLAAQSDELITASSTIEKLESVPEPYKLRIRFVILLRWHVPHGYLSPRLYFKKLVGRQTTMHQACCQTATASLVAAHVMLLECREVVSVTPFT